MKAYKGFDKDMKCRGFQYEEGKTYEEPEASLCHKGFHACENPMDTFLHYSPALGSKYHEVEIEDNGERQTDDTKLVGKKIAIGAEFNLKSVINASVKFIFEKCFDAKTNLASGERENAAASGERENAAASGESGNAAASGESGNAAASGESGNAAASGWSGNAAASGESGNAAASGESGTAETTGIYGSASAIGKECIAIGWGISNRAKASLGSYIVLAERDGEGNLLIARMAKVDGEIIKPDTWYMLVGGGFREISEEDFNALRN